ncbi:MAG: TRAP transporter large permease [Candidatus Lokiarchaeota archaeon]|nr:TRAP transporter large permease [Candidatus Lokiarchaeota archaeon]
MIPIISFFSTFVVLLIIGVPIAFSMILPSFIYLFMAGIPLSVVAMRLFDPLTSPTFLAIPFYILTAEILNNTGATSLIFNFARKLIGFIPGGLAQVNILSSMIFAGMSGSAVADAGGLGRIEIQAMSEANYDMGASCGITAASAVIGPIIPPSIPLVIYGIIAEESILRLFIGGLLPGILIGILLMIMSFYLAIKTPSKFPRDPKPSLKELLSELKSAFFALLLPVIIIGGILTGRFTPTEAGAIAVLYAIVLSLINRKFSIKKVIIAFKDAMYSTAMIMFLLGAALVFSWIVTISQIPQITISAIMIFTSSKILILFLFALLILAMGTVLTATASLIIIAPILVGLASVLNIDLVHLGVFLVTGVMIGVVTPPIGAVLFVLSDFTHISVMEISKAIVPYYIPLVISWLIIIYFPAIVLFLPCLLFG